MLLGAVIALCALFVLFAFLLLPGESDAARRAPFWGVQFAHRGLHTQDTSIPENSLAAFAAAVDAGYGIELDIRLTKDGEVVVFHDDDLTRACGVDKRVDALDYAELRELPLFGTAQRIPKLSSVLACVNGSVPLLVELKNGPQNRALCERAWRILRQYDGDFCVESFDPRIVRWFYKNVPGILRGQLAAPPGVLGGGASGFLVGTLLCAFLGRPQFIAYQKGPLPFTVRLARRLCMRVVWTARPEDDIATLEAENDAVIFEFYNPEPRYKTLPGETGRETAP